MAIHNTIPSIKWNKTSTKSKVKRGRILVVDDDKAIRVILSSVLKKHFDVTQVQDGKDALLWLLSKNIPDLIITDINMPNINGLEFIQNLKSSVIYQHIPVIVLSGYRQPDPLLTQILTSSTYYHLEKPFDPDQILSYILKIHYRSK